MKIKKHIKKKIIGKKAGYNTINTILQIDMNMVLK